MFLNIIIVLFLSLFTVDFVTCKISPNRPQYFTDLSENFQFEFKYKKGVIKCSENTKSIYFLNSTKPAISKSLFNCFQKNLTKCPGNFEIYNCKENSGFCSNPAKFQSGLLSCVSNEEEITPTEYFIGLDGKIYKFQDYPAQIPDKSLINLEIMEKYGDPENYELDYLYTEYPFSFVCSAISYIYTNQMDIYFMDKKNEIIQNITYFKKEFLNNGIFGVKFSLNLTTDMSKIVCQTQTWKSEGKNSTLEITVREKSRPIFVHKQVDYFFPMDEKKPYILCQTYGVPRPKMSWHWNEHRTDIEHTINYNIKGSQNFGYINFFNLNANYEGNYTCYANNSEGNSKATFTIKLEVPTIIYPGIVTLLVILGVLIPILLIAIFIVWKLRTPAMGLTKEEIDEFIKGKNYEAQKFGKISGEIKSVTVENVDDKPYDKSYEINYDGFIIDRESLLGSGNFGIVFKGQLSGQDCAVKSVRRNCEKSYLKSLLSELKIMTFLGHHVHLVNLLGAYTQELKEGIVYIFVEFCPMGNLENFLRNNRYNFENVDFDGNSLKTTLITRNYENENKKGPESSEIMSTFDLLTWAAQIASGMEYLANKKVVHADLASRNILLMTKNQIKITDFGLSKKIYDYEPYIKKQQQPLPWRWMALESLKDLNFSTYSDSWSYGVLLWEIFSLGDIPWPGLSWDFGFVDKLVNNMRMLKPQYCSNSIYELMLICWQNDQEKRPSFTDLKIYFEKILSDLNNSR